MVQTSTARNGNSDMLRVGLRKVRRLMPLDLAGRTYFNSRLPGPKGHVPQPSVQQMNGRRKAHHRFLEVPRTRQSSQIVVECLLQLDDFAGGLQHLSHHVTLPDQLRLLGVQ